MGKGNGARLGGRILLALLTLYALAMIAPDFARIVRPLGSFGLATNADGLIYDVQGPFAERGTFAGVAGGPPRRRPARSRPHALRPGRHESLRQQSGPVGRRQLCHAGPGGDAAHRGQAAIARRARSRSSPSRARARSRSTLVLLLDQIAGVLVVLGAAYLVWIRPGAMTWGFFAYAIQFNPGQAFQFYAWLQQWPWALLVQDVASCVLQAAGYTGLLLFALRAPVDRAEGRWRWVERALPALASCSWLSRSRVSEAPSATGPSSPCGPRS